jgi:glycosyltransferase involved in cell wall biosynthesis
VTTVRDPEQASGRAADPDLQVKLEHPLPAYVVTGQPTAIFCYGYCFHRHLPVADLQIVAGGQRHEPTASGMARRDLWEWLHRVRGEDPEGRSYRSGFWSTVPIPAQDAPGWLTLEAVVRTSPGLRQVVPLAQIEVVAREVPSWSGGALAPGTVAICMGTYEPDIELFAAQVDSLRAQTDERWICVVSDDGTGADRFGQMLARIGDDPRFAVSRAERRVGPYLNFQRALAMAPREAELMAPCDQDDRWFPDKLETLREALGSAQLVYSDYRLVTADDQLIRDTYWQGRRNEYRNLASVLVANTIAGASMLFRRQVAELALPFPNAPGAWYHDHWLALVALASGEVAYVDRPLYDYVQHAAAVSGHLATRKSSATVAGSRGLRSAYFGGYLPREVQAETLLLRCGAMLARARRKRRALEWFIASERSPLACLWLTLRPLRELAGHTETLGGEFALVRGIVWRWLVVVLVGRAQKPGRRLFDASFPDPPRFEQPRLRRWRAGA